jgi:phosphatidylserine decarboxylase
MVGALNVGGIHVRDRGGFGKGEEVGYFSMGSTVVMLLEAKGLEWKVKEGDKVRYGQVLAETIL